MVHIDNLPVYYASIMVWILADGWDGSLYSITGVFWE
jgi:hypothetical protein